MRTILPVLILLFALASCDQSPETFYVTVPGGASPKLVGDLTAIVERQGMSANSGSATDDNGNTLRVLEARGSGLHMWAQNMPRSPQEALACGETRSEAYSDPKQFVVTLEPAFPFTASQTKVSEAGRITRGQLASFGYTVTFAPRRC